MINRVHIGQMFFTERPTGTKPIDAQIMGNFVLLLADGRKIDRKTYPTLYPMLKKFDYCLPNETQEEDIQDHYIVARRLSPAERAEIKAIQQENEQ